MFSSGTEPWTGQTSGTSISCLPKDFAMDEQLRNIVGLFYTCQSVILFIVAKGQLFASVGNLNFMNKSIFKKRREERPEKQKQIDWIEKGSG